MALFIGHLREHRTGFHALYVWESQAGTKQTALAQALLMASVAPWGDIERDSFQLIDVSTAPFHL